MNDINKEIKQEITNEITNGINSECKKKRNIKIKQNEQAMEKIKTKRNNR